MELYKLLQDFEYLAKGNIAENVQNLSHNSKEENANGVFFAIDGTTNQGLDFVEEAISKGAKVIVSSKKIEDLPEDVTNIVTSDVRKAMSLMASRFYSLPSEQMYMIGVTGTNGKTTSTYMLKSIFESEGRKVGVIGTNGICFADKKLDSSMTTPDPIYLQKVLREMADNGVEIVCMEMSAHALELQKNWGIMFDVALFTNLTQDHLDFFEDMQSYAKAKAKLFSPLASKKAVINIDDSFGKVLLENCKIPALTISLDKEKGADFTAMNIVDNGTSQEFGLSVGKYLLPIKLNLGGEFNVSNCLGAMACAYIYGSSLRNIVEGVEKLKEVEGRFNCYMINGVKVVIDFAHTPDGLENILSACKKQTQGKLISVFGCGGNRDSDKRPKMGLISSSLADFSIITNDNPRFEKPEDIAKDIEKGMPPCSPYSIVLDRKRAIRLAISMADKGDTVVIAGKGAEGYIDALGVKTPYSDKAVVENIIKELELK